MSWFFRIEFRIKLKINQVLAKPTRVTKIYKFAQIVPCLSMHYCGQGSDHSTLWLMPWVFQVSLNQCFDLNLWYSLSSLFHFVGSFWAYTKISLFASVIQPLNPQPGQHFMAVSCSFPATDLSCRNCLHIRRTPTEI